MLFAWRGRLSQESGASNRPTAYDLLAVHPSAPQELLSVAYWKTVEEIQSARAAGSPLDKALHVVTRAYENVSKPEVRAGYNLSIGHATEPITTRPLSRRRWPFTNHTQHEETAYYEVMGLHETAPLELVSEARDIMRALYLRLPIDDKRRAYLLKLLEQANSTISDERSRARYDERRREAARRRAERGTSSPLSRVRAVAREAGRVLSPWARRESPSHQTSMLARLSLYLE